ncbi:TonB-dependent receptor [Sphingomonas sp.]|uniref:TonB-dependent receptor n=1 Tax=Sphingomonas sp. TaxID=28214 RepID=UPI001B2134B1|nr:TonB-dependent receptor [Sphingomonas sp.]MBO9711621.1 TonB-dependent receptor [Sphingomonas sp.]
MKPMKLLMTTAAAALVAALPAHAETKPADTTADTTADPAQSGSDDEIVVTAQKREQTLIEVPQSVSVVSGDTLERNQATQFQDYVKLVPGLQISQSNPGEARLVLRGINTGGVAATVSTYIDETPFGSSSGLVNGAILAGEFDTFDVARVEVLRGPQGTLYGASSLGGVLKFVTAEPDTVKLVARGRASVETTRGGEASYMGSAMVNVPLGDTLAVRASGFYRSYGGFIDSIGTAGSDVEKNINGSKSYGGRISALFKPSPKFSIRLTAVLQNLDTDAPNLVESDPLLLHTLYGGLTQSQYVPQFTNISYRLYNGTVNADLGIATLTSSTSYSTLKESLQDDPTTQYGALLGLIFSVPTPDVGLRQHTNLKKFTQEVRLASSGEGMFEWLVGGYYTHETGDILQRLDAFTHGTMTPVAGLPLLADIFLSSKYEEFAGFANGTVHFGPRFDVTVGGRYSHNKQSAAQGGGGILASAASSATSSEGVFTWSVAPKFKLADNVSLYARVAKGFRPGGPNILPPGAPANTPHTYDSDSLISYEAGIKAETSDRSFAIDLAAFHIDWSHIQLFAQVNGYGINANAGSATSDGLEFTATLRPTKGFDVSINGAYTDAQLGTDTDPLVGGLKDDALPYTPKYSVSVNSDYEWSVGGNAQAYVGGSIRHVAGQVSDYDITYRTTYGHQRRLPSYNVVDLRAGVDFGQFSLEAYVKNLTDSEGKTSSSGDGIYPAGAVGTGIIRPRTIGVTLGAGF